MSFCIVNYRRASISLARRCFFSLSLSLFTFQMSLRTVNYVSSHVYDEPAIRPCARSRSRARFFSLSSLLYETAAPKCQNNVKERIICIIFFLLLHFFICAYRHIRVLFISRVSSVASFLRWI